MTGPNHIKTTQLLRLIGTPAAPVLIDLRIDDDRTADPRRIPGSLFADYRDLRQLTAMIGERAAVVLCEKGRKISQGAAARLRAEGRRVEVLEGGIDAWRADGLPLLAADAPVGAEWVTRQRPKVDRIACGWLIRRFIDPSARILFVPRQDVLMVAERFGAIAFDAEGAPFADRDGSCSFDALCAGVGLHWAPLQTVAEVVRAADLGRANDVPQAAGLLALSIGLSRMHMDDVAQLDDGMVVYDALFRWARDGQGETHGH